MNRRKFLEFGIKGAAALSLGTIQPAEAAPLSIHMGELTQENLNAEKISTALALAEDLAKYPEVWDHAMRNYFPSVRNLPKDAQFNAVYKFLAAESRMQLPNRDECIALLNETSSRIALETLIAEIPLTITNDRKNRQEGVGFFTFGDLQKTYMIRKTSDGKIYFERSFAISTSKNGYSNAPESFATPLGMLKFVKINRSNTLGLLGEVISIKNPHREDFKEIMIEGKPHFFAWSRRGNAREHPEIVTKSYRFAGPQCPVGRGADWHGTNKMDGLGAPGSSGCQRGADIDLKCIESHIVEGSIRNDGVTVDGPATPVMIYANKKVLNTHPPISNEDIIPWSVNRPPEPPQDTGPRRSEPKRTFPSPKRFDPFDPFRSQ